MAKKSAEKKQEGMNKITKTMVTVKKSPVSGSAFAANMKKKNSGKK